MSERLSIEGLWVEGQAPSREWLPIARDVSVSVQAGEIVSLIGESGAGKTTVALSALGYCRPGTRFADGRVLLGDTDLLSLDSRALRDVRGRRVAYVAQSASAALNPRILIGKQLVEGLLVHGIMGAAEGYRRVIEQMELLQLPHPAEMAERYPYQVSGGQRQRVMIAMAMVCMPDFLILDEPTTALDVTTQIEVLKAVKEAIRDRGTGAVYVSHDLSVVAQVADRILVMNDGREVEAAATEAMLDAPREEYTRMLLGAVRLVPKDEASFPAAQAPGIASASDPLLEVEDVYATYERGDFLKPWKPEDDVLRGIDCAIREREVVALVGESGSGKSTLARVIAGLLPQRTGAVRYRGRALPPRARGRDTDQLRKVQIVFQHPDMTLNPARTIEYAIGRPLELYFGMQGEERRARVEELLGLVDLPAHFADRQPSELSGGEKQRVALARAFGAEPELIICDEVLSSLDTLVATTILELLKDLKERLGVAYLFVSHDLATVATIADRVIVMYAGRICEQGPTREVFSPPYHPYTDLLISSVPELRTDWLSDVLETREGVSAGRGSFPVDAGCAFRTRCAFAIDGTCDTRTPPARRLDEALDHVVYCHHDVAAAI